MAEEIESLLSSLREQHTQGHTSAARIDDILAQLEELLSPDEHDKPG